MYGKIVIRCELKVLTGMHIGASGAFSAIGAVDSPVVRDPMTQKPILPGSSLKGKLRTLLAQKYNTNISQSYDDDAPEILRLFGSAKKTAVKRSRLLFRDMVLDNMEELRGYGLHSATEVKFENNINRVTAIANPRQIERAIRGTKFALNIVYDMQNETEAAPDMKLLAEAMQLLEFDYLGGHGSRGYGKVKISGIQLRPVVGEVSDALLEQCRAAFKGV